MTQYITQSSFLSFFIVYYFLGLPVVGVTVAFDSLLSWGVVVEFVTVFFVFTDVFTEFFYYPWRLVLLIYIIVGFGVITCLLTVYYVSFFSAILSSGIFTSDFFGEGELFAVVYFLSSGNISYP